MTINPEIAAVTDRIRDRSKVTRAAYLDRILAAAEKGPRRGSVSCGNLAHGFAACGGSDKIALAGQEVPNIAIVTAYNDMLSAHQPYGRFPELIKQAVRQAGGVAQVAGGVPAMCDGVTQGQPGMELSLFSRDVIALATGVALSHDMFDGALYLGICDKIVPGLLMAALSFGHLPAIFVPSGPMPSGLPNGEKARIRQLHADNKVGRDTLLEAESKSYHAPGTCTFYGTANSNQMLMEIMGLHLPGASFIPPDTPLRDALTREAAIRALSITALGNGYTPVGEVVDERAIVNGIVGLHATGGSTNHTMHLVAIAAAAGIQISWDDFAVLSDHVPLLARIYPNGMADINHFHSAGGMGFLIGTLLDAGLLHEDVSTVWETGLNGYRTEAALAEDGTILRVESASESYNETVLRAATEPFAPTGGLKVLTGNLGRAILKISAVGTENHLVEAPAMVFHSQDDFIRAFSKGLDQDLVAVVRFQGPRANGMPELHKLTPMLGLLQDRGHTVALVTDGRMSGASGKIPAAIHVTPEAAEGGAIARIRNGDPIRIDARSGTLEVLVSQDDWDCRSAVDPDRPAQESGCGRELFAAFRGGSAPAESGGGLIRFPGTP